jgi:hypothetical protein
MWRSLVLALPVALAGCSSAPSGPGTGTPAEVRSIRLFDGAGVDRTAHLFLFRADTTPLEVRLYADDGRSLVNVLGGVEMTFAFDPASLGTSLPIAGVPLTRLVTTDAAVGTLGDLRVTLRFLADNSTRTFGPFECLVH